MSPVHRMLVDAIRAIAEPLGASVEYKTGAKHAFAIIRHNGSFRKVAMSNGTKCIKHQIDWAEQGARKALKSMDQPPA
jgi:hypothetical protein